MLDRYKQFIFLAVILAIGSGVIALLTYHPTPVTITIIPPGPTATAQPIKVYVAGAVDSPDTYSLPTGSRVQDAIDIAGGAALDADISTINLAQLLHDGDKVSVPFAPTAVSAGNDLSATLVVANIPAGSDSASVANTVVPASSKSGKGTTIVHINSATLEELQALPDVGPVLAQKILDYRTVHGPFHTMTDLDGIPGVGQSKLTKWVTLIVFD